MSGFLTVLERIRKNKTVRAVALLLIALSFIFNAVQFARDLPDLPGIFYDYIIWQFGRSVGDSGVD